MSEHNQQVFAQIIEALEWVGGAEFGDLVDRRVKEHFEEQFEAGGIDERIRLGTPLPITGIAAGLRNSG